MISNIQPENIGLGNLMLLKQKDACLYKYMKSFERFSEKKLPD